MNFSKQKVKKIFQSVFKLRRDRDISKLEFDPHRDWKIILALFFAGLIAVATFDAYVFFSVQKESTSGEGAGEVAEGTTFAATISTGLSRKSLEDALKLYEVKAKHFDALQASRTESYHEVPDPSR